MRTEEGGAIGEVEDPARNGHLHAAETPPLPALRASGGDRGRRPVDNPVIAVSPSHLKINSSSADVAIYFSSSDDVAAKLESDFAMSAAGVDLTNFLKGWGRSGGF